MPLANLSRQDMIKKINIILLLLSLLVFIFVLIIVPQQSQNRLLDHLQQQGSILIKDAFDDYLFSNSVGKANDQDGIANLAERINEKILSKIEQHQSLIIGSIKVRLEQVDKQNIPNSQNDDGHYMKRVTVTHILNDIPRTFVFGVSYETAWIMIVILGFLSALTVFISWFLIGKAIPKPFSLNKQKEIFLLMDNAGTWNYKEIESFVREHVTEAGLSTYAQHIIGKFHHTLDLETLAKLIQDERLKSFNEDNWHWFEVMFHHYKDKDELDLLFKIATSPDEVKINLFDDKDKLSIHGIPVEITATPLVYYYWYARKRKEGINEGWVLNPANDKNDSAYQKEIDQIIEEVNDCGKICIKISDNADQNKYATGKQLANNRNRIISAIKEALNDDEGLAEHYLFETRRAKDGRGRDEVRLRTDPSKIILIKKELTE